LEALKFFKRFVYQDIPIYINPEKPDWFVPTQKTDDFLCILKEQKYIEEAALEYSRMFGGDSCHILQEIKQFLHRIKIGISSEFKGRSYHKSITSLKECWFHITNQCNMACIHCMFASSPTKHRHLEFDDLLTSIYQASSLGCKVFYFTGGEPFLYKGFTSICDEILRQKDVHIVILTNGKNILQFDEWLKSAPTERIHFQLSIDGLEKNHDTIREKGSFQQLINSVRYLKKLRFPITLAMSVNKKNVFEMAPIVDVAEGIGVKNIHFLWLFKKGNATSDLFVDPSRIFPELVLAYERAQKKNIFIDNFDIIKSQIFSLPGTRFDLSNAGWESLAVGPDGNIYPSPAVIGEKELVVGHISEGLEQIWKKSPILEKVRKASLILSPEYTKNPFKYLIGGGDIDHSFIAAKTFVGDDPYIDIYNNIILYLLSKEAQGFLLNGNFGIRCRMGEHLYECSEDSSSIRFTHSNCVLSLPGKDSYSLVKSFYIEAARDINEDIVNPVNCPEEYISHIPVESRVRSYGCGSPVLDSQIKEGEVVLDLGSGTGIECFIASKIVGPKGKVYGLDMSETMLKISKKSAEIVTNNLGYYNVEFRKGLLEDIPQKEKSVDVVISNCVINLSPNKRRTFFEIMRILKPDGRICISDIVSVDEIPIDIKYNEKLRGECIGGAMTEDELFSMLEDLSFKNIFLNKRFFYRNVQGYNFYSITYSAYKFQDMVKRDIIYRGPFAAIMADDGQTIRRGRKARLMFPKYYELNESFFVLDEEDNVTNIKQEMSCSCLALPKTAECKESPGSESMRYKSGCLICGADIQYLDKNQKMLCHYCKEEYATNSLCLNNHYICDKCHVRDSLELIRNITLEAQHSDMIGLLKAIRNHPIFPMHGPEHHPLVSAIILSVYKNLGGDISDQDILTGIDRGNTIPGAACSFLGVDGAAIGVGIAYSIIFNANPYKGKERQLVQRIAIEALEEIAQYQAPRCCQRECWTALKVASRLSEEHLPFRLPADELFICTQFRLNKECIGKKCPLWVKNA
jgi:MoaA/NifB/PqqE/SkfB family radical SAM enzyme/ubiquinone/menaquinone biosynthesis C-methylase UbiE